jgi:predicted methyltransferase
MDLGSRVTLFTVVSGLLLLGGAALIVLGDDTLTVTGIVLITLSAVVFIVDAKDLLVKTEADEQSRR